MKNIALFLTLVLFSFTSDKLIKVKLNDKVTVYIPRSFEPMSIEDMQQRYQSYRLPLALYSDPSRLVDFGVNRSFSKWQQEGQGVDLELMGSFYESSLFEIYDKVTFIDKGIKEINDHQFVFFEFESVVYPENEFQDRAKKYTFLMYGISDGTTYVFNFTCALHLQQAWQPIAKEMMNKIRLKN